MQDYPDPILHVPLPWQPDGQNQVDLQPLVQAAMAAPINNTLICRGVPRCSVELLDCQLFAQQGEVQIIDLVRVGQHGPVCLKHFSMLLTHVFVGCCHHTSDGAPKWRPLLAG